MYLINFKIYDKEISRQNVESAIWFLLRECNNAQEEKGEWKKAPCNLQAESGGDAEAQGFAGLADITVSYPVFPAH